MATSYSFLNETISQLYDLKDTISINICNLSPLSSGSIDIISSDFNTQPRINLKTYQDEKDVETFTDSMSILYHIYLSLNEKVGAKLAFPTEKMLNDNLSLLKVNNLVTEHYTSSCRMGDDIETSVVDYDFNVHNITGLRICDASVLPYCSDGNPQYMCMLLGLRLGKMIKEEIKE